MNQINATTSNAGNILDMSQVESPKLQSLDSGDREQIVISQMKRPSTKSRGMRQSVDIPPSRRMNKTIVKNSLGNGVGVPVTNRQIAQTSLKAHS